MTTKKLTMTEAQAAEKMGVSADTLGRWRRIGKIHHWRQMGRLIRYLPEDIERNLAEFATARPRAAETNEQRLTASRLG